MDIVKMASNINKILDKKYFKSYNKCIDFIQLKNICSIYKNTTNNSTISLNDIDLKSPDFKKCKTKTKDKNIMESEDFKKKYAFFIRIFYSCLKMNIEIFDLKDNILILKNNYILLKSISNAKKKIISEHIEELKYYQKSIKKNIRDDYNNYVQNFIVKIKILEKITIFINKLIDNAIINRNDNLFTLILPYFYKHEKFIEVYK